MFPGATFAIGIDTVKRLGQARFYNNDPGLMEESFKNLISNNTRLLVFGRLEDGVFETLDTVSIPDQLRSQCEAVSEDLFRSDLSSTMLRQQLSENPETNTLVNWGFMTNVNGFPATMIKSINQQYRFKHVITN